MSERNLVIDNLRGIAMLGVIGIHAGDYVLKSATPWSALYVLLEVLTRFSVPAFFFISGYGLFTAYPLEKRLEYASFLKKRVFSIIIPYLAWSFIYLWAWKVMPLNPLAVDWLELGKTLFFGKASYHLYFLVLLWWFYVTLPCWRWLVGKIDQGGRARLGLSLVVLTALQLWLYDWSSWYWKYPDWINYNHVLSNLLTERFNYCPLFYGVVFIMGALGARHAGFCRQMLKKYWPGWTLLWLASAAMMVLKFYELLHSGVAIMDAGDILNQLTPRGLLYTVASLLCFCSLLDFARGWGQKLLRSLSNHSLVIYLVHPLFLDGIPYHTGLLNLRFDQIPMPVYYFMVLGGAWVFSILLRAAAKKVGLLGRLFLGRDISRQAQTLRAKL